MFDRLRNVIRQLKDEAGISLVESLVAIAILGVSAAAFITALSTGSIAASTQDEHTVALGLAQTQMETVKAAVYDYTGTTYLPTGAPAGYAVSVVTNSAIYSNANIQKVTVTVTHQNNVALILEDYKVNRQ